jgi:hypothetical protein
MPATPGNTGLLWCEGGDDFFKARIAAERVPKRQKLQLAIGESARGADGDSQLLAGEIIITDRVAGDTASAKAFRLSISHHGVWHLPAALPLPSRNW